MQDACCGKSGPQASSPATARVAAVTGGGPPIITQKTGRDSEKQPAPACLAGMCLLCAIVCTAPVASQYGSSHTVRMPAR